MCHVPQLSEKQEPHGSNGDTCLPSLPFRIQSECHMCQGLNSHYFHIIGDGHQPKSVGVYIPIIRIPIKGGRSPIPKKTRQPWPWHIWLGSRCPSSHLSPWQILAERSLGVCHSPTHHAFCSRTKKKRPMICFTSCPYQDPTFKLFGNRGRLF